MWHKLMTVVLVAAAGANGQTFPVQKSAQIITASGDTEAAEKRMPGAHVVLRYNKLRRGSDEQVVIYPEPVPGECLVHQPGAGSQITTYSNPATLHLESMQGFTIRYGNGKDFKKSDAASSTYTRKGHVIFLKLKAARDMPAGDYTIHGALGLLNPIKDVCPQQQDVMIRVTVVDHDADVAENPWPYRPYDPGADHPFQDVLFAIFLIPLLPILFIWGEIECGSPFCQD